MPITLVQIDSPTGRLETPAGMSIQRVVARLINYLAGYAVGVRPRSMNTLRIGQGAVRATGTLTFASASGTVGGTINGVSITVTAAGGDTATAALWAAAVNASVNPLVAGIVTASSALGVATLTATEYGKTGNSVPITASGTGVTASGARLTGGVAPGFFTPGRG